MLFLYLSFSLFGIKYVLPLHVRISFLIILKTSNKIALLIQARVGSTRLPNKMLLPFYKGKTILEIVLENLLTTFSKEDIILSTSTNPLDTSLVKVAQKYNLKYFQGAENDVIERFIKTSEAFNVNKLIRICADNPFLQAKRIKALAEEFENSNADYLSWFFDDGTPVIRTHSGFFAEAVSLKALKEVVELTQNPFFHEHVTNFIYENDDVFKVKKLILNDSFLRKIRLTIDTKEDFSVAAEIYSKIYPKVEAEEIKKVLIKDKFYMDRMAENIKRNEK